MFLDNYKNETKFYVCNQSIEKDVHERMLFYCVVWKQNLVGI